MLLQEKGASTFVVYRSNLSPDEILQRKRRGVTSSLSAVESAEKYSLQQGLVPAAQWSPAQWALSSKEELIDIGTVTLDIVTLLLSSLILFTLSSK